MWNAQERQTSSSSAGAHGWTEEWDLAGPELTPSPHLDSGWNSATRAIVVAARGEDAWQARLDQPLELGGFMGGLDALPVTWTRVDVRMVENILIEAPSTCPSFHANRAWTQHLRRM